MRYDASDSASAKFATTRWSLVASARDGNTGASRQALAELCQMYWYPLYAFARRKGFQPDDAADLVQGFLTELIDGTLLSTADPKKGRLRSYMLGALRNYVSNQRVRAAALKRGGGARVISLSDAENRYAIEPSSEFTAEHLFERRWALTVLESVFQDLRRELAKEGKETLFEQLKHVIAGPLPDRTYAQLAEEIGCSEGALKVTIHRLRRRFRQALMAQIADTVATPAEIDDEIKYLSAVIART